MKVVEDKALFDAISELKVIDSQILESVWSESQKKHIPLKDLLLDRDLISDENISKLIADLLELPYIHLSNVSIPEDTLHIIPEEFAKKQHMIVFKSDDKEVHIATDQPEQAQSVEFVASKAGKPVRVYYASTREIKEAYGLYAKDIPQAFTDIIGKYVKEAKANKNVEPPIIHVVDTIIRYAYQNNASDIHIEPLEEETLVRFRIDGVLHDMVSLPRDLDAQIVTRVKVMASLRTDEHQDAQDGKIVFQTEEKGVKGEALDIRVSIAPITRGEKIVMRLLSERSRHFSLADLGFSPQDLKRVEDAYHLPHGMILATGPTGSGKTTTLYAILKLINKREVNIMTIEDPVEYQVDKVNQVQVNPKTGLTFAKGLRSIVRQDPDVILVGEIRDDETADMAINSAMTGHLVLSSLHTNDAVTSFPRLMDMGTEPYLVASTVNVVIAQRLVRKICTQCKVSQDVAVNTLDSQIQKYWGKKKRAVTYRGKGCSVCHGTGYVGRIGMYEVIVMTDALREAVVAKKNASELHKVAVAEGMTPLIEDGVEKVKQGVTTIEEVLRVTKE